MTELEYIEIEGFKGLEYVEFEPTDINLITGRNNTGKTSFLETVDLLFQPTNLQEYGDNLDSVINVNWESSEIRGKTAESEVELSLRKPSKAEAGRYFSKAILEGTEYKLLSPESPGFEQDNEGVYSEIESIMEKGLESKTNSGLTEDIRDEILIFSIRGNEYPYLLGGEQSRLILGDIFEEIVENIGQKYDIQDILIDSGDGFVAHLELDSEEIHVNLGTGKIHLSPPANADSADFIKSVNLTEDIERTDDDQEPIRIDDIGDYIKQTGLVDNLKTFTLDYLVFEDENGEKNQIPYDFMGDGFKSIVGLLWELMDDEIENGIVLLEEPENHMHPGYIREVVYFLIELARKEDVQLFITTHDSDFINDFFTENLTDEEELYLRDEFSLLRMEEESAVVEDYETARENLKDLHLDLRGI